MLFSLMELSGLAVFATIVGLPIGIGRGKRRAIASLPVRFDVPTLFLESLSAILGIILLGRWAGGGCSLDSLRAAAECVAGLLGFGLIFAGPFFVGEWLGYWLQRRRRTKEMRQNPNLLIAAADRERVAGWISRDGEVLVAFRPSADEAEEVSFLVRSIDELLHVLLHHEANRATAELRATGGETLVLDHF